MTRSSAATIEGAVNFMLSDRSQRDRAPYDTIDKAKITDAHRCSSQDPMNSSKRSSLFHLHDQASLRIRPSRIGLTLFRASRF
jgi:hypothetical protein